MPHPYLEKHGSRLERTISKLQFSNGSAPRLLPETTFLSPVFSFSLPATSSPERVRQITGRGLNDKGDCKTPVPRNFQQSSKNHQDSRSARVWYSAQSSALYPYQLRNRLTRYCRAGYHAVIKLLLPVNRYALRIFSFRSIFNLCNFYFSLHLGANHKGVFTINQLV